MGFRCFEVYLFISFVRPKEMNQRKGRRNRPTVWRGARQSQMPTSAKTGACYTGLIGATVLSEVRTISGLPSRLENKILYEHYLISNAFRSFLVRFLGEQKMNGK